MIFDYLDFVEKLYYVPHGGGSENMSDGGELSQSPRTPFELHPRDERMLYSSSRVKQAPPLPDIWLPDKDIARIKPASFSLTYLDIVLWLLSIEHQLDHC